MKKGIVIPVVLFVALLMSVGTSRAVVIYDVEKTLPLWHVLAPIEQQVMAFAGNKADYAQAQEAQYIEKRDVESAYRLLRMDYRSLLELDLRRSARAAGSNLRYRQRGGGGFW